LKAASKSTNANFVIHSQLTDADDGDEHDDNTPTPRAVPAASQSKTGRDKAQAHRERNNAAAAPQSNIGKALNSI
jgi:hypothetical protein